ncbi:MAG: CDP-glycerol glycerophosphotransferase family protein, partial [Spirochaetaceae bacterium]|nr:CDP-glycerol glycerophosphotransferase family protein [Spirochaetaceae bacterium]
DYETENIHSLSKADIMISDFSGIIFDYVFLFDKPVFYVKQKIDMRPYDADDLFSGIAETGGALENLWQFKTLKKIGIELKEEFFDSIESAVKNASTSEDLRSARRQAREEAWQYPGESGRRIADFMVQTLNEAAARKTVGPRH